MPPSLEHDGSNSPSGTFHASKVTQKGSGAGGLISSRNGKKNGTSKDISNGGVLAAVTKNATKMSGRNVNLKPSVTPIESPEMQPVEPPLNGDPVTSPMLDALSSAAIARSSAQSTNEWAKNIPAYSSSPGNLINLGESPPTLPSSYDDRPASFGWTAREPRTVPNSHTVSTSPPANGRRPLSYQMEASHTQAFDDRRSPVPSYAARRSSMYSQHPRFANQPPLPHQAQAHFYGTPNMDFLPTSGPGIVPGENGLYCGFDSISSSHGSLKPTEAVLTGYEGGINIHAVSKAGLTKVSSLEGLRGGIYNAKILPYNIPGGTCHQLPLIAVVVHGPASNLGELGNEDEAGPSAIDGVPKQNQRTRGSPGSARSIHENDMIEYYQTTVEIYSLGTKQHVATLLSIPKVSPILGSNNLFKPPPPVGALTIRADGLNIVVASGSTGETWIFRQKPSSIGEFRCIGKIWTAVQHGISAEYNGQNSLTDGDRYNIDIIERKQYKASILSLSGRWLAYCPSTASSQSSLRATVPGIAASTAKVPGLNTLAAPQLPSTNCSVETPGGESMVKQIMQAGTQALIEGTTYLGKHIGKQGAQVWNNYWNRSPPNQSTSGVTYQNQPNVTHQFPPTHGVQTHAPAIAKDPGLVSILDLESLAQHAAHTASPHPLATFKIPHGCSFLSFAPSGLALFTASSKGDIQSVWDLMRIQFAKSSFLKGGFQGSESQGPHVRQIAQFSRMTVARIVDVVWTSPHGERAAMVTEPGTVHILDLPASAFTWPPPRRRIAPTKPDETVSDVSGAGITASGVATNAVNSLWTVARPLVSRRRRSSVGLSAKTVTAQAGHGTQVLAAGISRSVGAATGRMNEMRKAGSTKLHLPNSTTIPSRSCVMLLNRKHNDFVVVVGGGMVRLYTIKNRRADRPAAKQKASRGAKYFEFQLPNLPEFQYTPDLGRDLGQAGDHEFNEINVENRHWKPKKMAAAHQYGIESSIPQAEIESNAPYQPFHTDRRVSLYIYSSPTEVVDWSPSVSALFTGPPVKSKPLPVQIAHLKTPWSFGGSITATKLNVGPAQIEEDDMDSSIHRALPTSAIERILMVKDNNDESEQIVVTTRRRKGVSRSGTELAGADEEGFFEDDCEVLDFASNRV